MRWVGFVAFRARTPLFLALAFSAWIVAVRVCRTLLARCEGGVVVVVLARLAAVRRTARSKRSERYKVT